ncbi:hypothetical protein [Paenibacillus glufosinatiresistens]|nr:hypothetical protein [Paenibacillus sp. YX.27]
MAIPYYIIRIIASTCLIRHDAGEREIEDIVDSYALAGVDCNSVLA